ncbi:MAG: SixA phosphatase family protein [Actinomycetes bacterium]
MTVYLVRHASAGVRNDADPHDDDRPLDPDGGRQAEQLAEWLRHEPVRRVVTSPFLRCRQTVVPLAAALGLAVEVDDRLGEGTPVEIAWALLAELAGTPGADGAGGDAVVLCSHGDVIPDLVRRAQGRGMLVPGKSGCAKGSAWILQHWDGEAFATGVYTPVRPPA